MFLLDVRTPDEFALGSLPGAVNIPLDEIRDRIAELPSNKPIYTFCAVGLRGYLAYRILIQHGFKEVYNLSGGLKTYRAATAPIILHENEETDDTPSAQDSPAEPSVAAEAPQTTTAANPNNAGGCLRITMFQGPVLKMKKTMDTLVPGERVEIVATDPGF